MFVISLIAVLSVWVVHVKSEFVSQGRCESLEQCCTGRDSSCFVSSSDELDNQESSGLSYADDNLVSRPCYCDEGCLETGDCCSDYEEVCNFKVVNCEVSNWSAWSSCDRNCGKGVQSRSRLVIQHPSPGGKRCPGLSQNRACLGNRCSPKYRKYKSPIAETAGLLPAKYLAFKQRKPKWDVRENLFVHQMQLKQSKKKLSSFSAFNDVSSNEIEEGYQSDQPAPNNLEYCIVFELAKVTKACQRDKDFRSMKRGHQMCALCPEDAKRESLGGRCKGHGVDSKLTRWRSTVHSKCHGKWKRVQETRRCTCKKGPDFVFV